MFLSKTPSEDEDQPKVGPASPASSSSCSSSSDEGEDLEKPSGLLIPPSPALDDTVHIDGEQKTVESMFDNSQSKDDDDEIDDPETARQYQLASAWSMKRGQQSAAAARIGISTLGGGILKHSTGPIDVDEAIEAYEAAAVASSGRPLSSGPVDLDDDVTTSSSSSASSNDRRHSGALPEPPMLPMDSTQDDRYSTISAATSDMTPVICNQSPPRRGRRRQRLSEIDEQKKKQLEDRRGGHTWRDFCDYRTTQGKVALLLVAIFVLALVTILASSLASRRSDDNSNPLPVITTQPSRAPTPGFQVTETPTRAPFDSPTSTPSHTSTEAPTVSFPSIAFRPLGETLQGTSSDDAFGSAVALSADGRMLVVGSRDASPNAVELAGQVNVFVRDGEGGWEPHNEILEGRSAGDSFGSALGMSDDGTILAISEPGHDGAGDRAGNVRVFRYSAEEDRFRPLGQELPGSPVSLFGASLSLSGNGRQLAIGAPSANGRYRVGGLVHVYELAEDDTWVLRGQPLEGTNPFDWLGSAVDISEDGAVLVASAPLNSNQRGYVRLWKWSETENEWERPFDEDFANFEPRVVSNDRFGHSISVSQVSENIYRVAVGAPFKNVDREAPNGGIVTVFEVDENGWTTLGSSIGGKKDEEVGYAVKLLQGRFLAVGAPGADDRKGSVRLFRYNSDTEEWEPNEDDLDGDDDGDDFGHSVAISRSTTGRLVVAGGAVTGGEDDEGYVGSFEQAN